MLGYRIEFERDDNGTFLVTAPSLPEVTTFSDRNDIHADTVARAAIEEALSARIAAGADIPASDPNVARGEDAMIVYVLPLTEAKVELYQAIRALQITRAELQRRLHLKSRESVDRLFRLDHASRLDQIDDALHALGKRISIRVEEDERPREIA